MASTTPASEHQAPHKVVYIVQQAADGSGTSTIYTQSQPSPQQVPHASPTQPMHTAQVLQQTQPTNQVTNEKANDKNPVSHLYDRAFSMGAGRWLSGILVLGLSAGIISKNPPNPLLGAAAGNLACVSIRRETDKGQPFPGRVEYWAPQSPFSARC